jgi:hypothetical protein
VVLLRPDADAVTVALRDKRAIAAAVLDTVVEIRRQHALPGSPDLPAAPTV